MQAACDASKVRRRSSHGILRAYARLLPARALKQMTVPSDGVVTATYGTRLRLDLVGGESVTARIKGRKLRPVCGDRVAAEPLENENDWLIVTVHKRENELTRPNQRGKTEVLAANLDLLAAVSAALPKSDWYITDRYLCAAELMGIHGVVVYNKADDGEVGGADLAELENYRALDYETVICSAKSGHGMAALGAALTGHTAIITGQSGVGKSSLINRLTDTDQRTAAVSSASGEGRHTTVNSIMLPLPGGGQVVDSPGVRDYAPAISDPADVEFGFREIHRLGENCRFSNCRHRREPSCAVKVALEDGSISARRYESYKRMLLLTEQQDRGRY